MKLNVLNVLAGEKPIDGADAASSPLDETVVSAIHLATQAAQRGGYADPLSFVMAAVDLVHRDPHPGEMTVTKAVDPARAKVLADRQRLADRMTRIQALITMIKARRS